MTASPSSEREPPTPGASRPPEALADFDGRGLPPICPFLAGGDGSWRSVQPTRSAMCAAVRPPAVLTSSKQRHLCLGAGHTDCATFRAAKDLLREPASGSFEAGLWPRTPPRMTTLEPARAALGGGITSPQARAGGQALLVALIVLAFVVLVVARTTAPTSSEPGPGSLAPSGAPVAAAGATASPSPARTTAPSLAPSAPAASGTPAAGSPAAPSPGAGQTYKVQRGDTLSGIAAKFGVSVKALRTANDLAKRAVLRRGQVLVIPAPRTSPAP